VSKKVIAVVGPTASGKSSLGIFLAQKLGGEVISADSRQVYKGLNVGTGKVTKKEMAGVPHHLLDAVSPKVVFTADDFVRLGTKAHSQILKNMRIPIVVGGTGFYIDSLFGRMKLANVPPNPKLRKKLETKSTAELFAMLKKLDPARAKTIDSKNLHRLIRAIEIASNSRTERPGAKSVAEPVEAETLLQVFPKLQILYLGINPSDVTLKKNIHKRLLARMKQGMVAEARRLHKQGLSYKRMEELGLEYRHLARLLQNKMTQKEMLEELERAIWKYAKRQRTWFKRNKEIHWLKNPPDNRAGKAEALRLAKEFLSR
jgi:tRNA dimethylallyltransferase